MGLWHTHGSPNLAQKNRPNNNQQKKKRICEIVDFAVPADHRIKLKECEKKDKYLDLARELIKAVEHESDGVFYNPSRLSKQVEDDWPTVRIALIRKFLALFIICQKEQSTFVDNTQYQQSQHKYPKNKQ